MVKTTRPSHPYEDSEDRHARGVASMYGLTPKVEAAIRYTIRTAVASVEDVDRPPASGRQSRLFERISVEELKLLVSQLGSDFDAEILPYLHEESVRMFGVC